MKKVLCLLCLSFALCLSACGKEEPVKKSEIEIVKNDVYAEPNVPSDAQVKLFNKLSKAVNKDDDKEMIATLVAQNFAFDFFSLKNKESSSDVGGLTYLPEASREDFTTFASAYVYSNYATIKNNEGVANLPMVNEVNVDGVEATTYDYTVRTAADAQAGTEASEITNTYDAWNITIGISYDKTSLNEDELKKVATITVIDFDGRLCVVSMN